MQPKFTRNVVDVLFSKWLIALFFFLSISCVSQSQILINEGFDSGVPAGWTVQNNSNPIGTTDWFQTDGSVFAAHSGVPISFLAANFHAVEDLGTISDWLIMPNITLKNGDVFSFYTRVPTGGSAFPDRLQVRMSTNGASTNVGTTETDLGDFTTLLLDINPTYTNAYPEDWQQFTITISGLGAPTSGRLAFRYFVEDGGLSGTNSNFIGIDDVLYQTFSAPCTGTPDPGNTLASVSSVCPSIAFTLTTQNTLTASGLVFQWQSSATVGGPYSDIAGATSFALTTSQTSASYYRVNITCQNSTLSATSTPVQVVMSAPSACYCTVTGDDCSLDDDILSVKIGDMNTSTPACIPGAFEVFPTSVATTNVVTGPNPMTVTIGPGGFDFIGVWIDYNHNGVLEASEFTDLTNGVPIASGAASGVINIPSSALLGPTRMRVRVGYGFQFTGSDACDPNAFAAGETQDYTITIVPCVQGVITSQPVNTSVSCSGNATFSVAATGSLIAYQWEQRANTSAPWTFVADGGIYSGATTSTLTVSNVGSINDGYQFRALINGACTATDFSSVAQLTVTPIIATVSPTAPKICAGDVVALSLTNASSPATGTFTNTTSIHIPDDDFNGITSSVNVSGIPAGVVISNISVTFDITHTYVGDLALNLIAPNGGIINLVGNLDNGTGSNGTFNFTNTTISSTSTTPLSGAPAPRTGTFAADFLDGYGPIGFLPTTSSWDGLTSTLNGTWRLAVADFGAIDSGSLNSWSMSITYGAAATGIWSPTTSLFTDISATTPYTGQPATTVYAKPSASTSYSVLYSTASCTASPTVIPITVSNPVAGLATPEDVGGCVNGSASFSTSVTSAGTITYQWQVSTDGGTTYADLAGGTSSTINLNNLSLDMNSNLYRVIATADPCGADTSAAGTLTVHDLPAVTISTTKPLITPGVTADLTAISSPGPLTPNSFIWTLNGAVIPGATTTSINGVGIDQLGTYNVTVVDANGCSNSSNDIVITASASDRLFIFPNPTSSGQFSVRLYYNAGPTEQRTVTVFNALGVVMAKKNFTLNTTNNPYQAMDFDLSGKARGIYLVKVVNEFGKTVKSGFVVYAGN